MCHVLRPGTGTGNLRCLFFFIFFRATFVPLETATEMHVDPRILPQLLLVCRSGTACPGSAVSTLFDLSRLHLSLAFTRTCPSFSLCLFLGLFLYVSAISV